MSDQKKIWLSPPHMSGSELDYIQQAFDTNWIAPLGPNIEGFEQDLENYLGNDSKVVILNSGTAALHLSLVLLGVGRDDFVLCQTKTFVASANPIVYLGATPVFIDSEEDTWNMCPEQLEIAVKELISKRKKPKAIIAVHLYGMPYKIDEITRIANSYNIPIIEDSAEALGSIYKGRPCGIFGKFSVLSFNGNKIITTSGGGALVTKDNTLKERANFLANQARDHDIEYLHSDIGYNYRMSNILAGIGRGQMKVIEDRVKKRRDNFNHYVEHLGHISGISFQTEPEGFRSNRWLTCILLESHPIMEDLRVALDKHNIESRPLWKPMHQQPVFKDCPKFLNGISDDLFKRGLCLPSGSNLSNTDLERITSIIKSYFSV